MPSPVSEDVDLMADMVVNSPILSAQYFHNPRKAMASVMPSRGMVGRLLPMGAQERRAEQLGLAEKIGERIAQDQSLGSRQRAFAEQEAFLKDALINPQRTFDTILRMSMATFMVGIALVIGAFVAAVLIDDTTAKSIISGLAGGGGLVATLGTVFATTRNAIRRINGDSAQIRVILTDFASQMANLRGVEIEGFEKAKEVNTELRQIMEEVVQRIEDFVEPPEERAKEKPKQEPAKVGSASQPDKTPSI